MPVVNISEESFKELKGFLLGHLEECYEIGLGSDPIDREFAFRIAESLRTIINELNGR